MHPLGTRELEPSGRLAGNGLLTNTIGNPLETTIALSHLIFEGTLDRFPGLKICAAHGGGFLPSYANRSDAVITTFPDRVGPLPKKKPTEYLRNGQLYFDTIMFTGEAMRHLIAEVGIDHVVLGTDYPFPWNTAPVDHILSIPGISDADKISDARRHRREAARDRFLGGVPNRTTRDASASVKQQSHDARSSASAKKPSILGRGAALDAWSRKARTPDRVGRSAIRPRQAGNARRQLRGCCVDVRIAPDREHDAVVDLRRQPRDAHVCFCIISRSALICVVLGASYCDR